MRNLKIFVLLMLAVNFSILGSANADEHLFGYVRGAEPQPGNTWEIYQIITQRSGKGLGRYTAWDTETEIEYGFSDRFAALVSLQTLSIDTSNLRVDAYIPEDNKYAVRPSGIEVGGKYSYLTPAKDFIGLTSYTSLLYQWKDVHSGLEKDSYSFEYTLSGQKYFLEGELILTANIGLEATYALRADVQNLPPDFEWPVVPEMEIETTFATGLSYRFMPNWFAGGETNYQTEYETEVGRERYSWFLGPSVHYGSAKWWGTLTYFKQLRGGEGFEEQDDQTLHLVEKTKNEIRLKVGLNF